MTKRPDKKTIEERAYVARKLRALLETHEAALAWWVEGLQGAGKHWRRMLPSPEKGIHGRRLKHTSFHLASLLGKYRAAQSEGTKRKTFCYDVASEGKNGGFGYNTYGVHQFRSKDTVASALQKAERLAEADRIFDEEADAIKDDILSARARRANTR